MTKIYFTREEAMENIIDMLEYYGDCYCDLHDEVFNTNYYIVGTYEAKQALEQYGVFNAIEKVQDYEKDNFGEFYTDLSDPEAVANVLWYIVGDEVIGELFNKFDNLWDEEATLENSQKLIEYLEKQLNNK